MQLRSIVSRVTRSTTGLAAAACLAALASAAQAGTLSLNIVEPDKVGPAGTTFVFQGSVTNGTGATLAAHDLFLDFNGFDAGVVTLTQLLGGIDFTLGDGETSAIVDLFDFALGAGAIGGALYVADVGISDALGNTSDGAVTVSVRVPEPTTLSLLGLALLGAGIARRRADPAA